MRKSKQKKDKEKNNNKSHTKKIGKLKSYASFIGSGLLIILVVSIFYISLTSVQYLTPKTINYSNNSVLGTSSENIEHLTFKLISGQHNFITSERLYTNKDSNNTQTYKTILKARSSGQYSKPILEVSNQSYNTLYFTAFAKKDGGSNSRIGLLVNDTNYILISKTGKAFKHSFKVDPEENLKIYLSVKNESFVKFDEVVTVSLVEQEYNLEK